MIIFAAALLTLGALLFVLLIRAEDLPEPEPISPTRHLDERKATIYENLRDLQFEYRLGKLSDHDYQQTKQDLQRELAAVLAQIDRIKAETKTAASAPLPAQPAKPAPKAAPETATACPHCGAKFGSPLKFCGECGKPMVVEAR
jgi:hypothetical protein